MRPWLAEAVTWRMTPNSYAKNTHTQTAKICAQFERFKRFPLSRLSFLRHLKGGNTRTHSLAEGPEASGVDASGHFRFDSEWLERNTDL